MFMIIRYLMINTLKYLEQDFLLYIIKASLFLCSVYRNKCIQNKVYFKKCNANGHLGFFCCCLFSIQKAESKTCFKKTF